VPVLFPGAQGTFVGEDQINVGPLQSLAGQGKVSVTLVADGIGTNTTNRRSSSKGYFGRVNSDHGSTLTFSKRAYRRQCYSN